MRRSVGSSVDAAERRSADVRFRDGAPFALGVFVCMRLVLSLTGVLTVGTVEPPSDATAGGEVSAEPGWHNAFDGTDRWDAVWFERIAEGGYDPNDESAAFLPGYPLSIRAVMMTTPFEPLAAATLVSNGAFIAALIVLYALTTREYDTARARRTLVLLACFPASFFFLAPYSESLFLLAALLAFWWARSDRWVSAGMAGFVAALTRSVGVLLVPALAVEAWQRGGERRWRHVALACLPLLALVCLGLYWAIRSGDAMRPLHAQDAWMRTFMLFPVTIGRAAVLGVEGIGDPRGIYWTADLLLTTLLVAPLIARWRSIPSSYLVYAASSVLVVLSYPLPARPLLSDPRLLLVVFPAFWAMAGIFTGRLFVVAAVSFAIGFVAVSSAFMNWGFVF